ncbi:MAG: colicin V production protein [Rhodocyclales bacterium GWA2_65_20]|nr:MAG: colicin V production protein [Rhodocyclales bacterium GWA2_65_20]
MTVFDFAVLALIGASVLLGLWRGVASEILALAAWVAGFIAARYFGREVGGMLATWIADPALSLAAGFAAVFLAVLVVFALGRFVVSLLLRAVGLGVVDRLLGAVFGVARGVFMALAAVLVGGMTSLPKEPWWRGAVLAPPLETAVIAAKPWLPPEVTKRIRYK